MEPHQTVGSVRGMVLADSAWPHDLLAGVRFAALRLVLRIAVGWSVRDASWLRRQVTAVPADPVAGAAELPEAAAVISPVLAGNTAGWIGGDRWLLPLPGLPWRRGLLVPDHRDDAHATERPHRLLHSAGVTGTRGARS